MSPSYVYLFLLIHFNAIKNISHTKQSIINSTITKISYLFFNLVLYIIHSIIVKTNRVISVIKLNSKHLNRTDYGFPNSLTKLPNLAKKCPRLPITSLSKLYCVKYIICQYTVLISSCTVKRLRIQITSLSTLYHVKCINYCQYLFRIL